MSADSSNIKLRMCRLASLTANVMLASINRHPQGQADEKPGEATHVLREYKPVEEQTGEPSGTRWKANFTLLTDPDIHHDMQSQRVDEWSQRFDYCTFLSKCYLPVRLNCYIWLFLPPQRNYVFIVAST